MSAENRRGSPKTWNFPLAFDKIRTEMVFLENMVFASHLGKQQLRQETFFEDTGLWKPFSHLRNSTVHFFNQILIGTQSFPVHWRSTNTLASPSVSYNQVFVIGPE